MNNLQGGKCRFRTSRTSASVQHLLVLKLNRSAHRSENKIEIEVIDRRENHTIPVQFFGQ